MYRYTTMLQRNQITEFKSIATALILCLACIQLSLQAAPDSAPLLEESFNSELGKEWFWGLGTWTSKDGVLRGFESGPRRHGPVKVRRLPLKDAKLDFEFRLEGKASFAGIIFNGDQDRGHLFHLVMAKDQIRLLAHPKKGETVELFKQGCELKTGEWNHVTLRFKEDTFEASVAGVSVHAANPCIAEQKQTFGLGGESGGPSGESAGALEFRKLTVLQNP